ncbi:P-loop NTPase [Halanaerobium salsuginis]|uniref:MinD superfamily P-loop ATPase, contains an inserted ferredoxin domain n=1 Tax=Halanaerobium salsuginis TaxID=29563 RepID=A0A1I4K975_9FIRM|nr:ATP-binding protein [Halanaerobium salsuginis]SFL75141.1 MinD superfamily P-loop ATPase, contains an inserted ferredoxin domain [Halanaerobium salsuginis]
MQLTILSGKGGTGKTTVAVNLALSLQNVQLLDADVEEPNDYLLLGAEFKSPAQSVEKLIPTVDQDKCTACKLCVNFCQYNALALMLDQLLVFPEICHSCGGCSQICPTGAIKEVGRSLGKISQGVIPGYSELEFWQGELNPGEEQAVPVVNQLLKLSKVEKKVIIDAQPGIRCPTIEATAGSDFCLLVTEPTPFGLSDLKLAVELVKQLGLKAGLVINRSEPVYDSLIIDYAAEVGLPILLKIPFERKIAELYARGIPFVREMPGWQAKFSQLYQTIVRRVSDEKSNSN